MRGAAGEASTTLTPRTRAKNEAVLARLGTPVCSPTSREIDEVTGQQHARQAFPPFAHQDPSRLSSPSALTSKSIPSPDQADTTRDTAARTARTHSVAHVALLLGTLALAERVLTVAGRSSLGPVRRFGRVGEVRGRGRAKFREGAGRLQFGVGKSGPGGVGGGRTASRMACVVRSERVRAGGGRSVVSESGRGAEVGSGSERDRQRWLGGSRSFFDR